MLESEALLQAYARLIRQVSGARIASLYVPAPAGMFPWPILVHDGESPAVAELADVAAAENLCAAASDPSAAPRHPSQTEHAWLVRLPALPALLDLEQSAAAKTTTGRRRRRGDSAPLPEPEAAEAWLGLRFASDASADPRLDAAVERLGRSPIDTGADDAWAWLLSIGGALSWHNQQVSALLREPVSQLPGRNVLNSVMGALLGRAAERDGRVALLLINPDEFGSVNERFGREGGDAVIVDIANRLRRTLRQNDFVCRYGGAVFGVVLADAGETELTAVAGKIREALTAPGYLDGSVRLSISFGAASDAPAGGESAAEATLRLIRRADKALNAAKLSGGGRITLWRRDRELGEVGQFDRLSGIFTANQAKDYRNMLLLWDTVRAVTSSSDVGRLVSGVLDRLVSAFHPDRAGLFEETDTDGFRLVHEVDRKRESDDDEETDDGPSWHGEDCSALLEQACQQRRVVERALDASEPDSRRFGCAVPLLAGDRSMGALYFEGLRELDSSDRILLSALAAQLAIAIDRAKLAEQDRRRMESEQRSLRRELKELRHVLGEAKLVHRSPALEEVLAVARRVAPTDATVLVCGESGTGKELVARTIHGLSLRRAKPLVVVDCSAIATSLIDSELFGHERGAYTGADRRSAGRVAEAAGGTLLLDEIGELPLEVQGKLLRFAQERQFTAVGGTRPQSVDVRVIAATNRDLAAEVAAGRFREDLYYRLMVVQLTVPPLRERPEDVGLLAHHFVERFAVQYQKGPRRLSPEAEASILAHDWPGNVRELQNCIMQAVILAEQEEIGAEQLRFEQKKGDVPAGIERAASPAASSRTPEQAWGALRQVVGERIDAGLHPPAPLPLGKWIAEDLVLEAGSASGGVRSRAAALLGVPETTFRRRFDKAQRSFASRPADWADVHSRVAAVVGAGNPTGEDLLGRLHDLLLEELVGRVADDVRLGAAFMGVTEPTYRRWYESRKPPLVGA